MKHVIGTFCSITQKTTFLSSNTIVHEIVQKHDSKQMYFNITHSTIYEQNSIIPKVMTSLQTD
jgi:hypothetical protein